MFVSLCRCAYPYITVCFLVVVVKCIGSGSTVERLFVFELVE